MAMMMMIVILIVGITCDIAPIAGLNHNPTATAAIGGGGKEEKQLIKSHWKL